jgi:hypothetical protein
MRYSLEELLTKATLINDSLRDDGFDDRAQFAILITALGLKIQKSVDPEKSLESAVKAIKDGQAGLSLQYNFSGKPS